jgi:hypothetical protein
MSGDISNATAGFSGNIDFRKMASDLGFYN